MILSMLYDVNFIIGILVTLVLITLVSFYFTQRIEEQNEKIGAMSVVVQALVKGLTDVKNAQQYVGQQGGAEQKQGGVEQPQTIDLAALDEVNDLIEVSDDEEEEDDDIDDDVSYQTKSIQIGDSFVEEVNDINEIDLDKDSESSDSSDSESESSESSDSESESSESSDCEDIADTQEPLKESELFVEQILDLGEEEPEQSMYKTIHISLDDNTFLESSVSSSSLGASDYKKMSLSELRAIVVTKNLCTDSSKMKKQQLYKLLGVSVGIEQ